MARNVSAMILGVAASAAVSMSGGLLLGSYVVAGATSAYAAELPMPRHRDAQVIDADWPDQDYLAPVSGSVPGRYDPDQAIGVRASGSSRL